MESVINNLQNEINAPLRNSLDECFLSNFNAIFSYDNRTIKIVGTVDEPWFRAKDILDIIGYSENKNTQNHIIQKLDNDFKSTYNKLCHATWHNSIGYHEGKKIYVNEPGLYFLIMSSQLNSVKNFQMYVYKELIPNIRKIKNRKYENEIFKLKSQNNTLALKRLEETKIKLDDINNKLGKALHDRNVDPVDKELKHYYILFKNKNSSNEYMFVRGQEKYIKTRKNLYKTEFNIIIDSKKNPNPIDLFNRLKDFVKINCSDIITFRSNKITLVDYSEKAFLELINNLDDEKYNV